MKSKFTTYLLLAAVVVIWGLITFRLLFSRPEARIKPSSAVPAAPKLRADTLALDYPDPFTRGIAETAPSAPAVSRTRAPDPAPPALSLRYVGRIGCGGRTGYIIDIGDAQYMLRAGESACGLRLRTAGKDSLVLLGGAGAYGLSMKEP